MVNRLIGKRVSKEKHRFNYKHRDVASLKKRATRSGSRFDNIFVNGAETFRPKQGENVLRILPPTWKNHEHYGYDVKVHSYIGAGNGTYLCLKMKNKRCPICDAADEAQAAGEKDLYSEMKATDKVIVWMVEREKEGEGAKLWSMSWSQDREISAQCLPKKGKALYIDHPDEGYDVIMQRTGQGLATKYIGINIDRESTPIADDPRTQDKILAYIEENPIPMMLKYQTEEYLEKIVSGTAEEKDEDLDEDNEDSEQEDKPTKKRGTRRDEPEEEVEDEGDDEQGEDESDDESDDAGDEDTDQPDDDEDQADDDEDEPEEEERKSTSRTKLKARSSRRPVESDDEEEEERPRGRSSANRHSRRDDEEDERPRRSMRR